MKVLLSLALFLAASLALLQAQDTNAPVSTEQPSSDAAAEALVVQATDAAGLEAKVGSDVIVEGVVKEVGGTSGGGITFINFGERKTGFTAIVLRSSMDKFPEGFDKYVSQNVRVRGTLEKYKDRQIQIKITTPDQLEIVSAAP
ncbi:MAG: hypothetical protein RIQ71_2692 [Verrucomicrobiota bacterium]|jgi:DNA/RNA endonuclease YhcR with UshA esterase domain